MYGWIGRCVRACMCACVHCACVRACVCVQYYVSACVGIIVVIIILCYCDIHCFLLRF